MAVGWLVGVFILFKVFMFGSSWGAILGGIVAPGNVGSGRGINSGFLFLSGKLLPPSTMTCVLVSGF